MVLVHEDDWRKLGAGFMNFLKNLGAILKETGCFLFVNGLGIWVYFLIKFRWLDSFRNDKIDPVREWLGASLPLFAFCFGINVTWLLMSRKNALLGRGRLSIWLLVCLIWIIVLACDPLNLRGFTEMLSGSAWP